jgi:hypothetical protein
MTLRSPAAAMLWELWRLTRIEVALKLVLPIGGALTALLLCAAFAPQDNPKSINDLAAAFALTLIVLPHLMGWLSLAKLNGAQPGFPLYLSFTRPVRTAVIIGVPMAYLTAVSTAIYLTSAMVLRGATGYAFPLLPVAAWMAALTVIWVAASWATRSRSIQMVVTMFAVIKAWSLSMDRLTAVEIPGGYDWPPRLWPTLFDWPLTDYAWIALIGVVSFGITVAMVARQRRGDPLTFNWTGLLARAKSMDLSRAESREPSIGSSRGAFRDGLVSVFRLPCPTSSATLAQVWFDLRSNGLPVMTTGVTLALVIVLVAAVSGPIDAAWNADPDVSCPIAECFWVRTFPPLFTPFSVFAVLLLGGNAFGIRRRQGHAYVSAFEATQASGTSRLAVLKLLVKSACVMGALLALGVSAWMSIPLVGDAVFIQMWGMPLSSRRAFITDAFVALSGYQQLALAFVAVVGVIAWVALRSALGALRIRHRRRVNIAGWVLFVYGLAFVWLAVGVRANPETASQFHLDVVYTAMRWIGAAAMVLTTVYVFWSGFAENVLTIRYAGGALAISVAFGAAWLTALHLTGAQLGGMSAMNAVSVASPAVLPLLASGLAPWSYSRIRHS